MQEMHGSAEGALIVVKAISSSPGAMGVISAAISFIFLIPKTKNEMFCRVVAAGISSQIFGKAAWHTITHYLPWIPPEDIEISTYLLVGGIGWFLLGAVFLFFHRNRKADIGQLASRLLDFIKRVRS